MTAATSLGFTLAGSALGLALGLVAWHRSRAAWKVQHHRVDFAMALTSCVWMLHLLVESSLAIAADSDPTIRVPAARAMHLGYQVLLVSVGYLLLSIAGISNTATHLLLATQASAGIVALQWLYGEENLQIPARQAWVGINLLSAATLTLAITLRVHRVRSFGSGLALAGGIMGLGLGIEDWLRAGQDRQVHGLLCYFYAAFLVVVWHLESHSVSTHEKALSKGQDLKNHADCYPGETHLAVVSERRRIAQDLHDGVGTQIIHILSTLDSHSPQQKALVLALEQCLLDLKMTVDAIEHTNDSVLDALGRLRYRIQHSLDKLGIHLNWQVELGGVLESVRGEHAQHVLRITQESLANVMRHAQASSVEVVCCALSGDTHLVLEVRDDGQGITSDQAERPEGRGLENMRQRARKLHGELLVFTKPGMGTRVKLICPLATNKIDITRSRADSSSQHPN